MEGAIKSMIDPADAVMLLIDHQGGLFQRVQDIDMATLRHNVSALAKASRLVKLPTYDRAHVAPDAGGDALNTWPKSRAITPDFHKGNLTTRRTEDE